jgi:hypothetical protein
MYRESEHLRGERTRKIVWAQQPILHIRR